MKNSYNVSKKMMSPELILEIIKDDQMQTSQYDPEVEADYELTFDSTVNDWRSACDLVSWQPLGIALNDWFNINYSEAEWKSVLEPSTERTLLELCTFIAKQAKQYEIKSLNIFGTNCKTAGTFISIRTALNDAGVPTQNIKPSSELKPLLIQYGGLIIREVGKLAPNVLPPVKIEPTLIQKLGPWAFLLGWILLIGNFLFDINTIETTAYTLIVGGISLMIASSKMKPKNVTLGELKTFSDLCILISKSSAKKQNLIKYSI